MAKLKWEIVHDLDDEDGSPGCWTAEINSKKYGKFAWIEKGDDCFIVIVNDEMDSELSSEIMQCKSLPSAKRWVAMNLL